MRELKFGEDTDSFAPGGEPLEEDLAKAGGQDRVTGAMGGLDWADANKLADLGERAADLAGRLGGIVAWVVEHPGARLPDTLEAMAYVALGDLEALKSGGAGA